MLMGGRRSPHWRRGESESLGGLLLLLGRARHLRTLGAVLAARPGILLPHVLFLRVTNVKVASELTLLNPLGGFLKKISFADFYMKTKQRLNTIHLRGI